VLPEWLDAAHASRESWPDFAAALATVHRPPEPADATPQGKAWSRLAYDELLASQLALALVRRHLRRPGAGGRQGKARTPPSPALQEKLRAALPFHLTGSQEAAIADIAGDLGQPERMLRLLQGDVGAGKTVVALFAAAAAIAAGGQVALMAPTEILARQHLKTIAPLAQAAGIRAAILTGRERGRDRTALLAQLARGDVDLLIGTHALYSDDVVFNDLTLTVIDEQHRFGVHQRLALAGKGAAVDMLLMTATPIPRTLVLTYFGDMDLSELRDKPPGREPIDTRTIALDRLGEVIDAIGRAVRDGRRVYWVCPLVEESEKSDLAAAEARYAELKGLFGGAVDIVHGRQKGAEKDAAMARFAAGETRILIATTVIEVGVDVPEATVMVIEHADRFGLSQLHQLRGRIGRGRNPGIRSICILLYRAPLGETARARLTIMRDTEDGFRIAEEDLRLRGEGDVLGTRQSGMPGFRIAEPTVHRDLMAVARDDAALILARDPDLVNERGEALRVLLYLFERDEAVRVLGAG
jgi:ATP-dependent DNA helicase RecG